MAKRKKKEEEVKRLSDSQLRNIDNAESKQRLAEKSVEISVLTLEKTKLELELLVSRFELKKVEVENKESLVKSAKEGLQGIKDHNKEMLCSLKDELSIVTDKWGYDPLTGEVKDE
jgi:hypothetical protein